MDFRLQGSLILNALHPLREPDHIIGEPENPYMHRWFLVPRRKNPYNVYLHKILRSDDDRALHDHPWDCVSIPLVGEVKEILPDGERWMRPGNIIFRRAVDLHRLEVTEPAWTLFLTGPVYREWGFQCPNGWVHWRDFTAGPNGELIGMGCGES